MVHTLDSYQDRREGPFVLKLHVDGCNRRRFRALPARPGDGRTRTSRTRRGDTETLCAACATRDRSADVAFRTEGQTDTHFYHRVSFGRDGPIYRGGVGDQTDLDPP